MTNVKTRIAVTTFNQRGYEQYGRRMINTFVQFWPEDMRLIVISEDPLDIQSSERVIFYDYDTVSPEGVHFKAKFTNFSQAHGIMNAFEMRDALPLLEKRELREDDSIEIYTAYNGKDVLPKNLPAYYDYRFDAIRFSHKVFSIFAVSRMYDIDHLFWIDGDTYTHKKIDQRFFDETDPGDSYLSYLGRSDDHSECGFLIFNQRHPVQETFLPQMTAEYLNGDVFLLPEWHDSFIWDIHRVHYQKTQGVTSRNISIMAEGDEHPFINSILGEYMDHLKGNQRKVEGKSFDSDRVDKVASRGKPSGHNKKHPDISVIQNIAEIGTDPYPHAWVEDALPESVYRELEKTLPVDLVKSNGAYDTGGTSGDGGNFRYKSAAALTERKIPNIWLEFFEYHTSEEYFRSVISLFERQIENQYPQYLDLLRAGSVEVRGLTQNAPLVTDCQYVIHEPLDEEKTTRTPHLDNPIEIYAGLLYMKHPDDESTGGNFSVHEVIKPIAAINRAAGREVDSDIHHLCAEVPYKRNSYAMFLNVLNSVHSVTPRKNAKLDRVSINIIGEFNSGNRMWVEE